MKMQKMKMSGYNVMALVLVVVVIMLNFFTNQVTSSLSCISENGNQVDWWVILKAPRIDTSGDSSAASGFGYSYADSDSASVQWTGQQLDTNVQGALGSTLNQIYNAHPSRVAWLLYNDQSPDGRDHDDFGHTKGDIAFDENGSGFWLIHSVPRFPPVASNGGTYNGFPDNEKTYGQSFLCISLGSPSALDKVGSALLINKPYVFDSNLPSSLSGLAPNLQSVINRQWITSATSNYTTIYTPAKTGFAVFAKNKEAQVDLYSDVVEPVIQDGLMVETWMDGAISNKMPTYCTPQYSYDTLTVRQVQLANGVSFAETKDHSKWAIGIDRQVVCIGDINRQFSQANRGGGTACAANRTLYKSFLGIVETSDTCS